MAERPNIVVIMTDQQRADACTREGFELDTTPFLDSLARQGTWFDHAYTSTPVCTPARTSFLTGRFPTSTNVWVNEQDDAATFEADLFDVMNAEGYQTGLVGKNHSYVGSSRPDYRVTYSHWGAVDEDAVEARSEEDERWEDWMETLSLSNDGGGWNMDPAPTSVETQCGYRCVSRAQNWINTMDDEPFFLWLSFPEPHNPYQVPEPYFSMFPPEDLPDVAVGAEGLERKPFKWGWLRKIGVMRARREADDGMDFTDEILPRIRSNYYGMLRMIDDQVRRFIEHLDSEGYRRNTLVVFLSDHGDFVGQYGLMRKGVGLPEATVRIPMIFNGPKVASDREASDAYVSIVDVLPTLCDTVGAEIPPGVHGRSLRPVLSGDANTSQRFTSVYAECGYGGLHATPDNTPSIEAADKNELNQHTQTGRTAMIRRGRWKLVHDMEEGSIVYNLDEDPSEAAGLRAEDVRADVYRTLVDDFMSWSLRVRDTLPERYPTSEDPAMY